MMHEARPWPKTMLQPEPDVQCLPIGKRVRGLCAGEVVVDSRRVVLLREAGKIPVYHFPEEDVRADLLRRSREIVRMPGTGDIQRWHLKINDRLIERAAWTYVRLERWTQSLAGLIAFEWNALDAWFEEDEQVHVHPRDPFTRIDVLPSSRKIEVVIDGEPVAESSRPTLLFETGLPTRYYLPMLDVWTDRLLPSERITRCPYKGEAHYYHVQGRYRVYEDLVWYYPYPAPEVARIANLLCFYDERVDVFKVDGVVLRRRPGG